MRLTGCPLCLDGPPEDMLHPQIAWAIWNTMIEPPDGHPDQLLYQLLFVFDQLPTHPLVKDTELALGGRVLWSGWSLHRNQCATCSLHSSRGNRNLTSLYSSQNNGCGGRRDPAFSSLGSAWETDFHLSPSLPCTRKPGSLFFKWLCLFPFFLKERPSMDL